MSGSEGGGGVRILLVPEDGGASRSFSLSRRGLRLLAGAAVLTVVLLGAVVGSWWYLAARAARAHELQDRVVTLEGQQARIGALAARLRQVEDRYDRIRTLFGSDTAEIPSYVWLPSIGAGGDPGGDSPDEASLPTSWPLTERGFITQPLLRGGGAEHQGMDIAVPTDSYIRAAGAGTVVDVGEDPVYGRFIAVEHRDGYRTLYAHASQTLVTRGQRVRRNEVIGLTGSTGRSTAPHLHFEILKDGEPVDPLTMVSQPS